MFQQVPSNTSPRTIRKKDLLPMVCISKSKLHAMLSVGGPYYVPDFPKPFYLPKSRIPLWREAEVLAWLDRCERDCRAAVANPSAEASSAQKPVKPDVHADSSDIPW